MVMTRRSLIALGLLGACLVAALMGGSQQLSGGLAQENRLTAKRLERAFLPLLLKAHRAKDDLALQEAVSALAQAPGISFACVLDANEKSLAHSRLDQLGKSFALPREASRIVTIPLKDESTRWGTLIFSLSTRSTEKLNRTLGIQSVAFAGVLLALFIGYLLAETRRIEKQNHLLQDEKALGAEQNTLRQRLEVRLKAQQQDLQTLVACALERVEEPAILLDKRQRVAGVNGAAIRILNLPPGHPFVGLSWQDVPLLQDQGAEIEQALGQPLLFELQRSDALMSKTVLRVYR